MTPCDVRTAMTPTRCAPRSWSIRWIAERTAATTRRPCSMSRWSRAMTSPSTSRPRVAAPKTRRSSPCWSHPKSVADWVVNTVETLGAGWCPPGYLGIGVGGSSDKAMLLAKQALNEPIDMFDLLRRGPANRTEELRLEIHDRVNSLGIGAQGLGGLTTVLDVKIKSFPTHAASLPVGLIPNCAATRHVHFMLDGSGPAILTPPDLADWPEILLDKACAHARRIDLDDLTEEVIQSLTPGETLLLNGTLYTGRDAAHKRMVEILDQGEALPVDLGGRAIYYVGPVDAVGDEVIGPAGPTTATRMDRFTNRILEATGLRLMIGKAERGPEAIAAIERHNAAYLIAVGGAAYLVSKAIRDAEPVAFLDLGMEAIYRLRVEDMPVMVAVDCRGQSIHRTGPAKWRRASASAARNTPASSSWSRSPSRSPIWIESRRKS